MERERRKERKKERERRKEIKNPTRERKAPGYMGSGGET